MGDEERESRVYPGLGGDARSVGGEPASRLRRAKAGRVGGCGNGWGWGLVKGGLRG